MSQRKSRALTDFWWIKRFRSGDETWGLQPNDIRNRGLRFGCLRTLRDPLQCGCNSEWAYLRFATSPRHWRVRPGEDASAGARAGRLMLRLLRTVGGSVSSRPILPPGPPPQSTCTHTSLDQLALSFHLPSNPPPQDTHRCAQRNSKTHLSRRCKIPK